MPYIYRPLPRDTKTIRLLRLLASADKIAPIRCQLFEYSLDNDSGSHHYDALSYVWGDPMQTKGISVDETEFCITVNLFAALSRLRDAQLDRLFWIDALCINQDDNREKENQIQLMGRIYGCARTVLVWLGEEADESGDALRFIRSMAEVREKGIEGYDEGFDSEEEESYADGDGGDGGGDGGDGDGNWEPQQYTLVLAKQNPGPPSPAGVAHQAVLELLRRPWFRRIWVLQEVGLARSIRVICGPVQVDGYVFSVGLGNTGVSFASDPGLKAVAASVMSLMKGSIYRPPYMTMMTATEGLPLADLVNMYRTRGATNAHDKVYALLGLCGEDLTAAGLLPDYSLPWGELFRRLIRHIFDTKLDIEIRDEEGLAILKGTGYVFGRVVSAKRERTHEERQSVKIWHNAIATSMGLKLDFSIGMPAIPIKNGDIACHLRGSSRLWIIREEEDYFTVITSVPGLESFSAQVEANSSKNPLLWEELYLRDLFLTWDLNPKHDSSRSLTVDTPTSRSRDSERVLARHRHQVALVVADAEEADTGEIIFDDAQQDADTVNILKKMHKPYRVIATIDKLEKALGKSHQETLAAKQDLALFYVIRHDLVRAEKILLGVVRFLRRRKGPAHPDTLNSRAILVLVFIYYSYVPFTCFAEKSPVRLPSESWEVTNRCSRIVEKIRRNEQITVEDVIDVVSTVEGHGLLRLLALFFRQKDCRDLVTEDVVKTIAGQAKSGRKVLEFLFDRMGDDLPISEEVLKESAKNVEYGFEILEVIITRRGKELALSEEVVRLAAGNEDNGERRLHKLDRVINHRLPVTILLDLFESRGETIPLTEAVLMEAAKNRHAGRIIMDDFLRRGGADLFIPDAVVATAIRNWRSFDKMEESWQTLIYRQWHRTSIPESVVVAAAGHTFRLFYDLFKRAGDYLPITADVIIAAAMNDHFLHRNLQSIGESRPNIAISKDIVTGVIKSYPEGTTEAGDALRALLGKGPFHFSEESVTAILEHVHLVGDSTTLSVLSQDNTLEALNISESLASQIKQDYDRF